MTPYSWYHRYKVAGSGIHPAAYPSGVRYEMHGRVKKQGVPVFTEEEQQGFKEKVRKGNALIALLLRRKKQHEEAALEREKLVSSTACCRIEGEQNESTGNELQIQAKESRRMPLEISLKILDFYPEFATIWNYRKRLLEEEMQSAVEADEEIKGNRIEAAVGVTGTCLSTEKTSGLSDPDDSVQLASVRESSEGLLEQQQHLATKHAADSTEMLLQREMTLVEEILTKSPKSYSVWHHRFWTLQKLLKHYERNSHKQLQQNQEGNTRRGGPPTEIVSGACFAGSEDTAIMAQGQDDENKVRSSGSKNTEERSRSTSLLNTSAIDLLLYELKMCNKFFALDERNFHCWAHRQTVLSDLELLIHKCDLRPTATEAADRLWTKISNAGIGCRENEGLIHFLPRKLRSHSSSRL